MALTLLSLHGAQLLDWLDDIARLRIDIFYHYPYLYDGSLDYERQYLAKYAQSESAFCVLALDGNKLVGCTTAIALTDADLEFQAPFIEQGVAFDNVFYFGESLLQAQYRSTGIGKQFFYLREQQARQIGLTITAFCAVVRPDNHPLKPANYQPLDNFWRRQGYQPIDNMIAHYQWLDREHIHESAKPMQFWLKGYHV